MADGIETSSVLTHGAVLLRAVIYKTRDKNYYQSETPRRSSLSSKIVKIIPLYWQIRLLYGSYNTIRFAVNFDQLSAINIIYFKGLF
jgi:hypothetical protein